MTPSPHSSWAVVYDLAYERSFGALYNGLTDKTVRFVQQRLPLPAKIVDFGAGTGRLSIPLAAHGYDVVAVDPCSEMLDQLRKKAPDSSSSVCASRMEDYVGAGDCDWALCVFTVLLYLADINSVEAAFRAAFCALKPGGNLLVDIPSRNVFASYHRKDDVMDRRVTVTETANDVFLYLEELIICHPDGSQSSYRDEFPIRYWPPDQVLAAMGKVGFVMEEDCSPHFAGTGSHYYLMKRSSSTVDLSVARVGATADALLRPWQEGNHGQA
jgi:SAM-dependent methyltransferase